MIKKCSLLLTFIFLCAIGFSQNSSSITFQGETITIPENIETFQWDQMPETSKLGQGYYGWVQFYETPTQDIQDRFKENNLELLEYIPHQTYLFYFPQNTSVSFLRNNGVRAIIPIAGTNKISSALKNPPFQTWAMDGDNILVTLQYHKNANKEFVLNDLNRQQIRVVQEYEGSNIIDLSIPNNCLDALSNISYVKWIELIVAPSVKDDTRGRSLHRSSNLDTQTGTGRNYTGDGIGVMCRDDGLVGPHIDFQGRITNNTTDPTGTHGDGVSGIMAGAGNLNPSNRGMAAGSTLEVVQYVANFLDSQTVNLINSGAVQVTNSSYSNGCNAGYTSIARTVDTQTRNIPTMMHVFSAGNSNNSNCGYGAGNQWGNITGGHKQGKNVITTANVFFDGALVNSSSRGPAHDGRIKPDIAANGQNQISTNPNNGYQSFGGTSGAAPGIAGIAAQLYEAYGDANLGALPQSALIKAAMLNTANDAGNVGPDYKFGWGIVNALRAAILIEDGRYLSSSISQGATNNHSINVPAGTQQVRFMVYWSDPEASVGANPALVNDLDLVVTDPSSGTHLPYVLDESPNATTLDLPATNGVDHLNNMEQVLLNSPAAGSYDIDISGFNVPMGPQEYFVVYEIITDNIVVTYPNEGESFVPGETESIHWDSMNTTADFDLEYSVDNGGSWNTITTVPNDVNTYGWMVPSNVTGDALLRVSSGAFSDTSDASFSIANLVTGVGVIQVCATQATVEWNQVPGATSYDFYKLGSMYMDLLGNTSDTFYQFPITSASENFWVAVVARNNTDGWVSRRTIAINYNGGLLNCSFNNDLAVVSINNDPSDFTLVCSGSNEATVQATFRNTGIDPQSNFIVSYQLDSEPAVQETFTGTLPSGQQAVYSFTTPLAFTVEGTYNLTVSVALAGDQNTSNDELDTDIFVLLDGTPVDFQEPFDINGFPPAAWFIHNLDGSITWQEQLNVTGVDGNSTTTAFMNNYIYSASGQIDDFITEIFDLTNSSVATLNFDLAKAQHSSNRFDSLRVEVSIDCGATFTTVYDKTDLDLSTLPGYINFNWGPSAAADWRTEEIDLTAFAGEYIMLKFVNTNGEGNNTYVDNINVSADVLGVDDNAFANEFVMYPNPASEEVILLNNGNSGLIDVNLVNVLGQTLEQFKMTTTELRLNVSSYSAGLYFIQLKTEGKESTKKLIIK